MERCCAHCGRAFAYDTGLGNRRKYCGERCRAVSSGRRRAARLGAGPFMCAQCGIEYFKKSTRIAGQGEKYCSRECFFEWKRTPEGREHAKAVGIASGFIRPADEVAKAHREHVRLGYRLSPCVACGKLHSGSGYACSVPCYNVVLVQKQWERLNKGKVNTCLICGVQWCALLGGGGYKKYCSDEHRREGERDVRRIHKRIYKRKRREKVRAIDAERISREAVFDRDGWKCRACGCDTPRELMGTHEDDAPELDHIIPLAKGGVHTYANVMLLCRTCNGMKSDRDLDEFLLLNFDGKKLESAIESTSYGGEGRFFG